MTCDQRSINDDGMMGCVVKYLQCSCRYTVFISWLIPLPSSAFLPCSTLSTHYLTVTGYQDAMNLSAECQRQTQRGRGGRTSVAKYPFSTDRWSDHGRIPLSKWRTAPLRHGKYCRHLNTPTRYSSDYPAPMAPRQTRLLTLAKFQHRCIGRKCTRITWP